MKSPVWKIVGSLAIATVVLTACSSPTGSSPEASPSDSVAETASYAENEPRSITEVREAIETGEESAEEVVARYLDVVSAKNLDINAIVTVNTQALNQARELDLRIANGDEVGQLAGVPFVVKENMDLVGFPTTGGSIGLRQNYPAVNAPAIQRLLDEDAIVIGKANMSELAASYGRLGYSSNGGLTVNPYNLERDASGSSSGSAAAVASGMAVFALGTDTSGSVRGPASATGTIGLRPSFGAIPRTGVIPLALSFDTVGAFTSTTEDQAILLDILAGEDSGDSDSISPTFLAIDGDNAPKIGVVRAFMAGNDEVDEAINQTLEALSESGATVVDVEVPDSYMDLWNLILGPVGDAEFASQFESYLDSQESSPISSLSQLISFYEAPGPTVAINPINPGRLEGLKLAEEQRDAVNDPEIQRVLRQVMPSLRDEVEGILDGQGLSALVFPTMSCVATPAFGHEDDAFECEAADPYAASYLGSATGLPEVSAPVGFDQQGLPIGISFLGRMFSDKQLLEIVELAAA